MATSPDLELKLGSLSISDAQEQESVQVDVEATRLDLNQAPARTPTEAEVSDDFKVGLVYSEQMMLHACPKEDHPEQPARISSIYKELQKQKLVNRMVRVAARDATNEELESVHTRQHVHTMKDISKRSYGAQGRAAMAAKFNSIYFNEGSTVSSLLAAGSVVEVATQVAQGRLERAAAIVRPPGHHAEADMPMGFCLYNNVAVAAHWLVHKLKLVRRVLIVDWDVHHGNGTQHMFYTDPSVLYFSPHRYDFGTFYPCSADGNLDKVGEGAGAGFNVNVPWPWEGFGDADYLVAWDRVLLPIARQFDPEIVLISAGFDAAKGDPLGECAITPYGYSLLTHKLLELAGGKIVLALEGGYNLDSISKSYAACTSVLLGDPPLTEPPEDTPLKLSPCTPEILNQVRAALSPYWSGLQPDTPPIIIESVEIVEVSEVSEVPFGAQELLGEALVVSPSERDLGVAFSSSDEAPVEELEPSSGDSEEYADEAEIVVVELERTLSPGESTAVTGAEEMSTKEVDPRDAKIAALEDEVWRLKELTLKLKRERELREGASGSKVGRIPGPSASEERGPEASSSGESHRMDTSKYGLKVLRAGDGSTDSVSNGSAASADMRTTYVWYASFGSNLWEERFMCYIKGGKLDIMGTSCAGTSDPSPPTAKESFLVPRRLFFGHKSTARWGQGGVAFLMPIEAASGESTTILRAYRITLEQFNEVVAQENRMLPADMRDTFVTVPDLQTLRTGNGSPPGLAILDNRWYGNILYLGDHQGEPVLSFTCSQEHANSFMRGDVDLRAPSKTYKQALVNGLTELGLPKEEAELYVDLRGKTPLDQRTG